MDGDNVDIGSLTDAQLADMLRQYGVDVGPILASTRRVYQKKLQTLVNGAKLQASHPEYEEYEDEDEYPEEDMDEEPDEEDPEIIFPKKDLPHPTLADARQRIFTKQPQPTAEHSQPAKDYGDRPMSASTSSRSKPQNLSERETTKPETKKEGGLSIWVQLGIFVIVALIIFLVIQNMEPAREDPLKQLGEV